MISIVVHNLASAKKLKIRFTCSLDVLTHNLSFYVALGVMTVVSEWYYICHYIMRDFPKLLEGTAVLVDVIYHFEESNIELN